MIVVPGYGMAVAQAQHQVRELADLVEKRGGTVKYAIHPVAGRMPGHMNVLLAEANVPYDQLYEMDEINGEFDDAGRLPRHRRQRRRQSRGTHRHGSPIYGMPIINADHAKMTVVLKRSMAAGFAGIENELFYAPADVDAVWRREAEPAEADHRGQTGVAPHLLDRLSDSHVSLPVASGQF